MTPQAVTPPAAAPAPALVPGTPEYDAAMVAKFEAHSGEQPPAEPEVKAPATRPESIPEKFWNAEKGEVNIEALLKSQADAERALRELQQQKAAKPAEKPVEGGDTTPKAGSDPEAAKAVAAAGLDMDALSAKYAEKGTLEDSDFEALAKVGINKPMVEAYIAGQVALAEKFEAEVITAAGGEEAYGAMATWAAANLDAKQLDAYNAAVQSGDAAQAKLAVAGLKAQYAMAVGSEPKLLGGGQGGTPQGGYSSRAEMVRDMSDPKYSTDSAFRAQVEAKLAATTAF